MWPPGKSAERRKPHEKTLSCDSCPRRCGRSRWLSDVPQGVFAYQSVHQTVSSTIQAPIFRFRPAPRIARFRRPTRFRTKPAWIFRCHAMLLCTLAARRGTVFFHRAGSFGRQPSWLNCCLFIDRFAVKGLNSKVSVLRKGVSDGGCNLQHGVNADRHQEPRLFPMLFAFKASTTDHDPIPSGSGRGTL